MKCISYLRVSTARQGRSGLGLEAQREAVKAYLASTKGKLLSEHVEIESGKKNGRPELLKALHHAKVTGAKLVVAKLDRLSRNAAFLMTLKDSGVDFVACDMPDANAMTVGVLALVAQHERDAISSRTKAALAALKRRGVRLGNPKREKAFGKISNHAAVSRIKANADEKAKDIAPVIAEIQASGITTLREIATALNEREIKTARGGQWHAGTVRNLLMRTD